MFAYIKNGVLDSYSEEFFAKPIPERTETVTQETEDGEIVETTVTIPEVSGLAYDEAVEYDFDDVPVLEDGAIVPYSESRKKAEDDAEKEKARVESANRRKAEIRVEIGRLSNERAGLAALMADENELSEIDAKIETLRTEYLS